MSAGFINAYHLTMQHLDKVAEQNAIFSASNRPPERLVAAIWLDQQLDHINLRTVDDRKISITSPGRWSDGIGPDFREARWHLSGGKEITADVEVEVFASEWKSHGHSDNPDFADVKLRVCMWNDIRKPEKSAIPLLELFPYLADKHLLTIDKQIDFPLSSKALRGKCTGLIAGNSFDKSLEFLAAAGDKRIQEKAERMASNWRTFGLDQTVYRGLMEAMGYASNKLPMARLADSLHLDFISSVLSSRPVEQRPDVVLSLFYGVSGYFETIKELPAELQNLQATWQEISASRPFYPIEGFRLTRTRPLNNPYRRMAAIAAIMGKINGLKLFDYLLSALGKVDDLSDDSVKRAAKRLQELLTSASHPFWDKRLSPLKEAGEKTNKLIGDNLARIIVVNIFIPLFLAYARQKQNRNLELFIHKMFGLLGGQQHNSLTKFTCARLFGPETRTPAFAANARIHQGLIQVYYDFCRSLRNDCPDCDLVDFLVQNS
jgi:hypothetical protein